MSTVNRVIIVGNLGRDPELKFTPNNRAVCNFSIATSESFKDKGGQKQEKTEWHKIIVWGEQAELCAKYLVKGRSCYVEGKLQTRQWDDKDGNKRSATEVVATHVVFLGGKEAAQVQQAPREPAAGWGGGTGPSVPGPPDDDVPFAALSGTV